MRGLRFRWLVMVSAAVAALCGECVTAAEQENRAQVAGDMNADGVVDRSDITMLVRAALDPQGFCDENNITPQQLQRMADLDQNGRVDMHDVQITKERLKNPPRRAAPTATTSTVSAFPLGVWMQSPSRASEYKKIGINLYVGLWKGPTPAQLQELAKHHMPAICDQNEFALQHLDNPLIYAWMYPDEPDNSQASLSAKGGYQPPVPPAVVSEAFVKYKKKDFLRPVFLNLGQGVAWDEWHGRGTRTNHPEDYPLYCENADIVSFDFYPLSTNNSSVYGDVWRLGHGVRRLIELSRGKNKRVWTVIGTTSIHDRGPTPEQIKAQVWMSIIHGARGIIYFVHQFQPTFIEAALLQNQEGCSVVARTNLLITELSETINAIDPSAPPLQAQEGSRQVHYIMGKSGKFLYLFAVPMQSEPEIFGFDVGQYTQNGEAEVIDEGRSLSVKDGMLSDRFTGWQAHIYRIALAGK